MKRRRTQAPATTETAFRFDSRPAAAARRRRELESSARGRFLRRWDGLTRRHFRCTREPQSGSVVVRVLYGCCSGFVRLSVGLRSAERSPYRDRTAGRGAAALQDRAAGVSSKETPSLSLRLKGWRVIDLFLRLSTLLWTAPRVTPAVCRSQRGRAVGEDRFVLWGLCSRLPTVDRYVV